MKKIVLKKDTKIYIMAPANSFTGGPELLHQIAISIKKIFKVNPIMFYLPVKDHNPIHKQFKKYISHTYLGCFRLCYISY